MNQTKYIIKYKSKFLNRLFNIRSLRSCRLYFNCLFFICLFLIQYSINSSSFLDVTPVKKKRGRPPKQQAEDGETREEDDEVEAAKKAKRALNRFNGMSVAEVMAKTLPDVITYNLDILIVSYFVFPVLFCVFVFCSNCDLGLWHGQLAVFRSLIILCLSSDWN